MTGEEKTENIFKAWSESYALISKMWEDSYIKIYKPWLESSGELFAKAIELTANAPPEKYKEFYESWLRTYQKNFKIPSIKSNKETLEKLYINAEETNNIYRSWITELEENSKLTREILETEDSTRYKEIYDTWIKSYGKMFDELLTLPFRDNIKVIFEEYTGIPDIYSDTFIEISKLWKESYSNVYQPWLESLAKLSEKSNEISRGNVDIQAYKEFYDIWVKTFQETYGKIFDIQSPKTVFETFAQNTNTYINLYKSWMATIEKISSKKALSKQNSEIYRELFMLWAKTYEKSVDIFFENTPTVGPFKSFFEPVKRAAKIYTDTFVKAFDVLARSWSLPEQS